MGTEATPAREWKGRRGTPLDLPSGNTALVRAPGIQHFLKTGKIPNTLRNLIQESMTKKGKEKMDTLLEDPEQFNQLFELFDNVLVQVVIEPAVAPIPFGDDGEPIPLEDRDQDFIYPDEVDLNDKAFIFQYAVGGTRSLERFREGQDSSMASILPSEDVGVSAE